MKVVKMYKIPTHTFGEAIEAVKKGARITRLGWNGNGHWIELGRCFSYINAKNESVTLGKFSTSKALMFVGDKEIRIGWLASQDDILAEDWVIDMD